MKRQDLMVGDVVVVAMNKGQGLVTVRVTELGALATDELPIHWGEIVLGGRGLPAGNEICFAPHAVVQHLPLA